MPLLLVYCSVPSDLGGKGAIANLILIVIEAKSSISKELDLAPCIRFWPYVIGTKNYRPWIPTCPPRFSDLPTALTLIELCGTGLLVKYLCTPSLDLAKICPPLIETELHYLPKSKWGQTPLSPNLPTSLNLIESRVAALFFRSI